NTGFPISFEGIYKWIAFVHSKRSSSTSKHIPVPNRYFGVFEDDGSSLKVRGLEMRRRDNPPFFDKFQTEVLKVIAKGNTIEEVRMLLMPQVKVVLNKYVQLLKDRKVPLQELVFTKQLSKDSDSYVVNTIESAALRQLSAEGRTLRAGEILQYVITNYYNNNKSSNKRATPFELIDNKTTTSGADYDAQRYIELLVEVAHSVTEPFNFHGINFCAKQAPLGDYRTDN
ncbi:MAG: hypothetical protein M3299_09770, partial [Thermoproteota archaeon]|nr:hypothetical protein [Thermoproteota archaeon]